MASWERMVEYAGELGPDPELVGLGDDELVDRVRSRASTLAAERARWIVDLAELVVRGVWAEQGARTPGAWLSWAVGLAPSTAREHVRVGLALRTLPLIRSAFLAGEVSYSKVRAVTRLAGEETEELLLDWCDAGPAAEIERIVRSTQRSCRADGMVADPMLADDPSDATDVHATVERYDWQQHDDGAVELRLRMDQVDGARVVQLLDWLARQEDPDLPRDAQVIAALVAAVEAAMDNAPSDTSGLDRDRLVVDATLELVEAVTPGASAEAVGPRPLRLVPRPSARPGPALSASAVRRMFCEAGIVPVVTDGAGNPLDVGRTQRLVAAKQRRALKVRDPHCRFPGCTSTRRLHAHHAIEWNDDGRTDMDNLLHLCGFHHRFLHDRGWQAAPLGNGRFRFLDAAGNAVPDRLPMTATATAEAPRTASAEALQPAHWDGAPIDLDLCVAVLRQALDRRRALDPPPQLASAA